MPSYYYYYYYYYYWLFFFFHISTTNSVSEEKEKVHLSKHDTNTHKRLPEVSLSLGKCILTNPEKIWAGTHLTSTRKNVSFFKTIDSHWSVVALQQLYCKVNQPYVQIYPSFFGFPSHLGHMRALKRVPWAILYTVPTSPFNRYMGLKLIFVDCFKKLSLGSKDTTC